MLGTGRNNVRPRLAAMAPTNDLVAICVVNGTCCSFANIQCPLYHQQSTGALVSFPHIHLPDWVRIGILCAFSAYVIGKSLGIGDDQMAQIRGTAGYNLGAQDRFGGPGRADATNDPSPLDAIREQTSKIEDWLDTLSEPVKP